MTSFARYLAISTTQSSICCKRHLLDYLQPSAVSDSRDTTVSLTQLFVLLLSLRLLLPVDLRVWSTSDWHVGTHNDWRLPQLTVNLSTLQWRHIKLIELSTCYGQVTCTELLQLNSTTLPWNGSHVHTSTCSYITSSNFCFLVVATSQLQRHQCVWRECSCWSTRTSCWLQEPWSSTRISQVTQWLFLACRQTKVWT